VEPAARANRQSGLPLRPRLQTGQRLTLLERELRQAMARAGLDSLPLYPEGRPCRRPTTRRVIDGLASLTRHRLITEAGSSLDLHTETTPLQRKLIQLCGLKPSTHGRS